MTASNNNQIIFLLFSFICSIRWAIKNFPPSFFPLPFCHDRCSLVAYFKSFYTILWLFISFKVNFSHLKLFMSRRRWPWFSPLWSTIRYRYIVFCWNGLGCYRPLFSGLLDTCESETLELSRSWFTEVLSTNSSIWLFSVLSGRLSGLD